jgi:hypothetical protein
MTWVSVASAPGGFMSQEIRVTPAKAVSRAIFIVFIARIVFIFGIVINVLG